MFYVDRRTKHENSCYQIKQAHCNLCKALQRFAQHEKSEIHEQATEKLAARVA